MKWISVEYDIPEYGTEVLILLKNGTMRLSKRGSVWGMYDKWDKIPSSVGCGYYFFEDVSHWMPLPKPPEK